MDPCLGKHENQFLTFFFDLTRVRFIHKWSENQTPNTFRALVSLYYLQ